MSPTTVSAVGPASSTPHSSNVSRTAAQTRALTRGSVVSKRRAHQAGSGPAQAMSAVASEGSTPPPGNTVMPAATRTSITVEASLGWGACDAGAPAELVSLTPAP
ncbi:Uncharacterised protein [Mycobacteroides abscessus subsp. abscessus]|nr:Uncharacterised protein [Mycobacteroides abscessus subsp. abscessus]